MRLHDSLTPLAAALALGLAACAAPADDMAADTMADDAMAPATMAVALPTVTEVTGPGPMFDSAPSHDDTWNMEYYGYEQREYFLMGSANAQPYTARMVVRKPVDDAAFSGFVLAESMHGSGAAHVFEYTSAYTMASGHAAVEITTTGPDQFVAMNPERYSYLQIGEGQTNEILAQAGALIRSGTGPMAGLTVRRMVLAGTSMSAGTLSNYLEDHAVYRTPEMGMIFDGYLPTSSGGTMMAVDVPTIQIPTMHEMRASLTDRADSDAPGEQYRLYVFPGMGHIDSRDNVRLLPNPCVNALSEFPLQAYMAVGLDHLFRWADEGVAPPRADRIPIDGEGDESGMALDAHGNPLGGIRNPYVDVPTASYTPVNTPADPPIASPSAYVAQREGGAAQMCRLSAYQEAFSVDQLRELYGSPAAYVAQVEASLGAAEAAGWSLPMYREMILADARAVTF
jgi:hypothetical protein